MHFTQLLFDDSCKIRSICELVLAMLGQWCDSVQQSRDQWISWWSTFSLNSTAWGLLDAWSGIEMQKHLKYNLSFILLKN